jgi:hypothetical protein
MVVSVDLTTGAIGKPTALFAGYETEEDPSVPPSYDVSPDGERFLMLKSTEVLMGRRVNVVTNWLAGLRTRTPRGD